MRRMLAMLAPLLLGVIVIQHSGDPVQTTGITDDFESADPVVAGEWLDMSSNAIYHYMDMSSNMVVTDDPALGFPAYQARVIVAYDETQGSMGQDGNAILRMWGSTNGTADFHGVHIRADCTDFVNSPHISFFARGDGLVYVREYTGYTNDADVCAGCVDAGSLDNGDYIGFEWSGAGENLVMRVWDFDGNLPADPYDWTTWGTCDVGLYEIGKGSAPSCTTDQGINLTGTYEEDDCFAFFHQDTSGLTTGAVSDIWIKAN